MSDLVERVARRLWSASEGRPLKASERFYARAAIAEVLDAMGEVSEAERIAARRKIVFESPHGCNNDLADDIFAKTWSAATAKLSQFRKESLGENRNSEVQQEIEDGARPKDGRFSL